jgi:endonuclease/exonuclease/phosphatase (EEP) superfamily protein YafD
MNSSNILRQLIDINKRLLTIGTLFVILLAITGHLIRDHTIVLAFMMYIPLLPLGLWAIVLDFWQAGRSLPKFRFSLTFIGLGIAIWGAVSMIGTNELKTDTLAKAVSLLHWNVKWGGIGYDNYLKNNYDGHEWASIRQEISQHQADIIVLSEPPQIDSWLAQLIKELGPQWKSVKYDHTKRNGLAILSPWPLEFENGFKIRDGIAMFVIVTIEEQSLRLLLVDGKRSVRKLRTPRLVDIIQIAIDFEKRGETIDLIVGDFNAVSRSLGFDVYNTAAGGYQLASKADRVWRGTWPVFLPLYDIDHVWVHKRFEIQHVDLFSNLHTDHRGQIVFFR